MKIILSSRRHHYVARVSIFLIAVVLIAGMVGCVPAQYNLTISSTAGGSVTATINEEETVISQAETETISDIPAGTVVDLVAEPDEGYRFVNWTGDVGNIANVEAATTTITMNGDYSVTAEYVQTALFTVTYIGGDPAQPATISRGGINYTITVGMKILDEDYLETNTQRVQFTDMEEGRFRFGPYTKVEVCEVNFTREGFGLYLDLGELYAYHKCVKIRSSCWADCAEIESYYFASFDGNVGQFDAVSGDLCEGEYDEFGVFHKDYDIPEGYYLRMTGWPPDQVFELGEIAQDRLDYIAINYGDDSMWEILVGGIVEFPQLEEPEAAIPDSSEHNYGASAGIIAGVVVGVAALIGAAWYIRRRRTKAT